MIDLHNAGPLIAEVARLREEVAAFKAEASLHDIAAVGVDKVNADIVATLKAEVARLAGVAREACDELISCATTLHGEDIDPDGDIADGHLAAAKRLRASIPTPDPAADPMGDPSLGVGDPCVDPRAAAFVDALDAYGQWCGTIGASLATGGTARFLADCERERDTYRAALLKLGGAR